ncbi:Wzz/FepE/Etk N-terminal domain-containing protein [Mesorhizobium sp. NPDC059025]|uniref:Wzz/FepE/Etk N-terminal domain-containing protein n=1 Tax=unclassified Mesorhizobium TaxID=325217 RepID=UPI00369993BC
MRSDYTVETLDLGIADLIRTLWNGRLVIAGIGLVSLLIGIILFFVVPRSYQSEIEITPLRQTQFSLFTTLANEKIFPYTPEALELEYATYVRDFDNLVAKAKETGVVRRSDLSDQQYDSEARKFVGGIVFETPPPSATQETPFLRIVARSDNAEALTNFVTTVLRTSSQEMAKDLAEAVRQRANGIKEAQLAEVAKLKIDIAARRQRVDAMRNDQIAKLSEQADIARSLKIEKPIEVRALDATEQGRGSVQINSANDSDPYLRGYLALDEQIVALKNRKDNDPFIDDLREQQQRIYTLENDPLSGRILTLLSLTPLADSSTTQLVRYSLASATAEKVFPRASVFLPLFLLFGFGLGIGYVLLHEIYADKASA